MITAELTGLWNEGECVCVGGGGGGGIKEEKLRVDNWLLDVRIHES